MKFTDRTAADPVALTATFDDSETELAAALTLLADQLRLVVPTYLGLSVIVTTADSHTELAAPDHVGSTGDIRSSMSIPASQVLAGQNSRDGTITLIVYAGAAGALVDLAADLAWLTSRPMTEFALDHHLAGPSTLENDAITEFLVNQAIGVLLGRGKTPQQAIATLDAMAARDRVHRRTAASALLDDLAQREPEGHS